MGESYTVEQMDERTAQARRLEDITGRRGWSWRPAKNGFYEMFLCPFVGDWMLFALNVPSRGWYVLIGRPPKANTLPVWLDLEHITLAEDHGSPEAAIRAAVQELLDHDVYITRPKST